MALKRAFSLFLPVAAAVLFASPVVFRAAPVHAEDSRIDKAKADARIDKAKKAREEILLKRRDTAVPPTAKAEREDPFQEAVAAARERLAAIDAQIEQKRRHSETLAAPREKLTARSDELNAAVAKLEEEDRARVEAIYRSAKLGAGAAGWHPDPARSARLSRYLAAIAAHQHQKLEVVEVEQGSVIASLDRARAEDAAAANELRVLDADRAEAEAALDRATAEANGGKRMPSLTAAEAEAEALAQQHAIELADSGGEPATPPRDAEDSAAAVQRAMALLEAKRGIKPVAPAADARPGGDAATRPPDQLASLPGGAPGASASGDFSWPASVSSDSPGNIANPANAANAAKPAGEADAAKAASDAKIAAAAKTVADAKLAAEAKAAADAKAADAKTVADAKAAADAKTAAAKAEAEAVKLADAKTAADAKKKADAAVQTAKAAAAATNTDDGEPPELEDGPAVLAPSTPAGEQVASVPAAQAGGATAGGEPSKSEPDKPKRPNLFSRMFGGDRESDAFASERGSLPPPVAGKVVANYGQQHKSGATYRGVILRAGHNAPIKAVAPGKVSFAGNLPGLGNTVIVSHGGRYHTVYARLGALEVKEGQTVSGGTEIGALPDDNADMHFELRDQGKAVDPVPWLKGGVPGAAQ